MCETGKRLRTLLSQNATLFYHQQQLQTIEMRTMWFSVEFRAESKSQATSDEMTPFQSNYSNMINNLVVDHSNRRAKQSGKVAKTFDFKDEYKLHLEMDRFWHTTFPH